MSLQYLQPKRDYFPTDDVYPRCSHQTTNVSIFRPVYLLFGRKLNVANIALSANPNDNKSKKGKNKRGKGFAPKPQVSNPRITTIFSGWIVCRQFTGTSEYRTYTKYRKFITKGDTVPLKDVHQLEVNELYKAKQINISVSLHEYQLVISADGQSSAKPTYVSKSLADYIHSGKSEWFTCVNLIQKFLASCGIYFPFMKSDGDISLPEIYLTFADLCKVIVLLICRTIDLNLLKSCIEDVLLRLGQEQLNEIGDIPINDQFGYYTVLEDKTLDLQFFADINKTPVRGLLIYTVLRGKLDLLNELVTVIDLIIRLNESVPQKVSKTALQKHIAKYNADVLILQQQNKAIYELVLQLVQEQGQVKDVSFPEIQEGNGDSPL